jgi:hypothetical protein
MKICGKPIVLGLASGAMLFAGVTCLNTQAAPFSESGTSVLADAFGTDSGPEALTVSWSVNENMMGVYTYAYVISNPAGDVLLNSAGQPTGTPEIVDSYAVGFDTTVAGAYIAGSIAGGVFDLNNGVDGLSWQFTAVPAGNNSPELTFESDLPPTMGDADAQDANPPSPWSSFPDGQPVPVPAPLPDATSTLAMLGGTLGLFRFRSTFSAGKKR